MFWYLVFATLLVVLWFAVLRPQVVKYRFAAGILDQLDKAGLSLFQRFKLLTKGLWAAIVSFVAGLTSAAPDLVHDVLLPFDWAVFLEQDIARKVSAGLALAASFIAIFEQKAAAQIVPKLPADQGK
jgi:hypothetical protein